MADHLQAKGPRPELILCSTAIRARQTLAPLVAVWSPAPPISLEKGLYLAPEYNLLARLRRLSEDVGTVLLIGHNDGIWQLAEVLAGTGNTNLMAALHEKYPTGALATLHAPVQRWSDLSAGFAELAGFVRPRDLLRN
jgi:phosphohistidine phosphatase